MQLWPIYLFPTIPSQTHSAGKQMSIRTNHIQFDLPKNLYPKISILMRLFLFRNALRQAHLEDEQNSFLVFSSFIIHKYSLA